MTTKEIERWLTNGIFIEIHNDHGEEPLSLGTGWYTLQDAIERLGEFLADVEAWRWRFPEA